MVSGLRGQAAGVTAALVVVLSGVLSGVLIGVLMAAAAAAAPAESAKSVESADRPDPADPYQSWPWLDMKRELIGAEPVRFDRRVEVQGPAFAEDPMNVPISVRVDPALGAVARIVVLVDRNPIRRVLEFEPLQALASIGFRFKLEQASPVRAAVKLRTGDWVVGGTFVDSAGGGCTVSGATRKDGSWAQSLGNIHGRLYSRADPGSAAARLRLQVMHPMDTGLVAGVPAFYVNRLSVRDGQGRELARLQAYEPVSENPVFSVDFAAPPPGGVQVMGTDNNGNRFTQRLQ